MADPLVFAVVTVISLTSLYVLVSRDWRFCLAGLAVQYVGVFLLVNMYWPLGMAVTKMLAGWMACAILGIAMTYVPDSWTTSEKSLQFGRLFRLFAALIVALAITSLVYYSQDWLATISAPIRWGGFFLIGLGLLHLSLTTHPLRVIVGLLTVLSGFEVFYAAVESSTLVTGLLAFVNLGLALVGAYLLIAPAMESAP